MATCYPVQKNGEMPFSTAFLAAEYARSKPCSAMTPLLHFLHLLGSAPINPYCHARHYLNTTNDLEHRLPQHAASRRFGGVGLMEVVTQADISWRRHTMCLAP